MGRCGWRGAAAFGAALLAAMGVTVGARAQQAQRGFAVDTFDPSARGSDWFVLDSLDVRDDGRGALGIAASYAFKPFVAKDAGGAERVAIVDHQLYLHPGGALTILDRLRLSASLPIAVYDHGNDGAFAGYTFTGPSTPALGDLTMAADLRVFGHYGEVVTGAVGLEVIAPTGSPSQYTGDGKTRLVPRLQAAGVYRELTWAARVGVLFRTGDDPIAGQTRGHALVFGAAAGWRPAGGKLVVGPEIYGSTSLTSPAPANTPLEAILGVHYAFAPGWRVGVAAGPGMGPGIGTPALRTVLSLEFVPLADADRPKVEVVAPRPEGPPDRDHDTVADTLDACPDAAGPPNVDPALNGCPPPPDRDGDGIADPVDACPDERGSANADPDQNGCPPDADDDGVPDDLDACPLRPGVEQTDKLQNGCPPDSDHDGVVDADDACPDRPGPMSKDPEDNGCPIDPDRDHDGIPNEVDACPREAGPKSADPAKNGCPKPAKPAGKKAPVEKKK